MSFKHISTSVVVCGKIIYLHLVNILVMPRYFSHTKVLIIKVYRKKVLLIPPNPTINMSKCHFMQSSVEYLGNIITKEGIQPSQKKVEAILKVKEPTDSTQLKSLLGMVNHYSKFLKYVTRRFQCTSKQLAEERCFIGMDSDTSKQL